MIPPWLCRLALVLVALAWSLPAPARSTILYTSVGLEVCASPAQTPSVYARRDLYAQRCPGTPPGWRLYVVSSQARSWLDLWHGDAIWSLENSVVYDHPIGDFPNIGGAAVVEWHLDSQGRPLALIFRVTALESPTQGTDVEPRRLSRLYVVRLAPRPCLLGVVTDNREAREMVAAGDACAKPLAPLLRPAEGGLLR